MENTCPSQLPTRPYQGQAPGQAYPAQALNLDLEEGTAHDGPDKVLGISNMQTHPITGTTDFLCPFRFTVIY